MGYTESNSFTFILKAVRVWTFVLRLESFAKKSICRNVIVELVVAKTKWATRLEGDVKRQTNSTGSAVQLQRPDLSNGILWILSYYWEKIYRIFTKMMR